MIVRRYLKPALGRQKLCELIPIEAQKFVNQLCRTGLNPKTVKNIHGVLHRALNQAMRIGFLRINPAGVCNLPKIVKNEITPLQGAAVAGFLRAINGERFETLFFTALFTGMRQSELLGLQWKTLILTQDLFPFAASFKRKRDETHISLSSRRAASPEISYPHRR